MTHHVQVRLESEEYEMFRKKAEQAGFDGLQSALKHLVITANKEWGEPEPGKIPPKLRPYLKRFEALLASRDGDIIDAVTSNVDVFSRLYELQKKYQAQAGKSDQE